jgi:uncharacterized OB-fold protein
MSTLELAKIEAMLPRTTAFSAPFWEGCDREELLLCHCGACGHVFYYPRPHCIACGSEDIALKPAMGTGRVFSFTHVSVSFYGPAWNSQLPYTVVLVDLDEGPRFLSRMVGADTSQVAAGDLVRLHFISFDGHKLPYVECVPEEKAA